MTCITKDTHDDTGILFYKINAKSSGMDIEDTCYFLNGKNKLSNTTPKNVL